MSRPSKQRQAREKRQYNLPETRDARLRAAIENEFELELSDCFHARCLGCGLEYVESSVHTFADQIRPCVVCGHGLAEFIADVI